MNFKDCTKFASENPMCFMATVDGDQPRVRPMGMFFADDTGFYFNTESSKAIARQMKKNQKVELCFHDPGIKKVMRVTGKIEILNDPAIRKKFYTERPILKGLIKGPDDPELFVFRLHTGEAFFWTMADNTKEAGLERIKF
jgi:pyridoxamine 5'-phosphate oxidase